MGLKKAAISGQLADVDLRLLRVFKTVVDAGGFSAAEIELNLANSTISNYIADLEKRLDMRLCQRGRSGFNLTEHGRVVYDATLDLLGAIDQFRNQINRSHNKILGQLHLGFAEHLIGTHNTCIAEAISDFTAKAPDVRVKITTMGSDEVTTAVLNKQVDIGITVLPHHYPDLDIMPLFNEEMLLYCGSGHPLYQLDEKDISKQQLQQYKFVESPRLMPGREVHPDMKLWHKHAIAHHQEARATLIMSGHYLGILPCHLVNNLRLENKLRPLFPQDYGYSNTFKAIWRKKHPNELIINIFNQCLLQSTVRKPC